MPLSIYLRDDWYALDPRTLIWSGPDAEVVMILNGQKDLVPLSPGNGDNALAVFQDALDTFEITQYHVDYEPKLDPDMMY
jgi:hypothetical protein